MTWPEATTWTLDGERFAALQFRPAQVDMPPPVALILHGFPDHPPHFGPVASALVDAGYHVVAPWMRGYAPTTCDGPFDLDRLRDDVLAIMDQVSPERPVVLIGHDWGALTTYAVCAAAPHRVRRAVVMSVPTPLAFLRQLATSRQLIRSWYIGFFQLGIADAAASLDFALIDWLWRQWSPQLRLRADERNGLHACLAASWPAPLGPYRAMFDLATLRHRFAELRRWRIAVPTLQLHGNRDGCIAPAATARQRALFTREFEQRLIANAGHFLHLEAPDRVTHEIVTWLAR